MRLSLTDRRTQVVASAVASLLLLAGLIIGFFPVSGTFDSEGFDCGSAFVVAGDDGGYGGTDQYRACERERGHLRWVALGSLLLGVGLIAGTGAFPGRRSDDRAQDVTSTL